MNIKITNIETGDSYYARSSSECLTDTEESAWESAFDTNRTIGMGIIVAEPINEIGRCIFTEESCSSIEVSTKVAIAYLRASKFTGIKAQIDYPDGKILTTDDIMFPSSLNHFDEVSRALEILCHLSIAEYSNPIDRTGMDYEVKRHMGMPYIEVGEFRYSLIPQILPGLGGYRRRVTWNAMDSEGDYLEKDVSFHTAFLHATKDAFVCELNAINRD